MSKSTEEVNILVGTELIVTSDPNIFLGSKDGEDAIVTADGIAGFIAFASVSPAVTADGIAEFMAFVVMTSPAVTASGTVLPGWLTALSVAVISLENSRPGVKLIVSVAVTGSGSTSSSLISKSTDELNILLGTESAVTLDAKLGNVKFIETTSDATNDSVKPLVTATVLSTSVAVTDNACNGVKGGKYTDTLTDVSAAATAVMEGSLLAYDMPGAEAVADGIESNDCVNFTFTRNFL